MAVKKEMAIRPSYTLSTDSMSQKREQHKNHQSAIKCRLYVGAHVQQSHRAAEKEQSINQIER